jgi:hypothetical protein
MKPVPGQKNVKGGYVLFRIIYPILNLFFSGMDLSAVALAMIHAVRDGAPKQVLDVADIRSLSGAAAAS